MWNHSRARMPSHHARASIICLLISGASAHAAPSAPRLPSMPAPVTHVQHTTTTTTSTSTTSSGAKTESYNWAAPAPKMPTTVIYNGQPAAKAGLSVVAWGGGSGSVTQDVSYTRGGNALKVVTHGLYEGARIDFNPEVPLGADTAKNRIFQMIVRFGQADDSGDDDTGKLDDSPAPAPRVYAVDGAPGAARSAVFTSGSVQASMLHLAQSPFFPAPRYPGAGGYPGGGPRYPSAGRGYPGPGYPGQGLPGSGPRGRGGYPNSGTPSGTATSDAAWNPPVHYFRLLFTLQNGAQAEILRPTPWPNAFDDPDTAWLSIGVPLSRLKFNGDSNSPLASITLGGDGPASFYIGQMNLVDDNAPIICSAGPTQDVAAGDDVTFTARAQGGASMLTYSWDFDASDGIIDEADGATVTHKYHKGDKDYTVTLTVSDLDGIKKPCTSTVKVKVEE